MANQPKLKRYQKVAAAPGAIVQVARELGFFPEPELHPIALHNAIENRALYKALTLSDGVVDRLSWDDPVQKASLIVIRRGPKWRITRAVIFPSAESKLSPEQVRQANIDLAEILA